MFEDIKERMQALRDRTAAHEAAKKTEAVRLKRCQAERDRCATKLIEAMEITRVFGIPLCVNGEAATLTARRTMKAVEVCAGQPIIWPVLVTFEACVNAEGTCSWLEHDGDRIPLEIALAEKHFHPEG